jgi:two-component sensor histidine kinase
VRGTIPLISLSTCRGSLRTFSRNTGLEADISLSTNLEEEVFFDMDTAVPLGMIVNELVSNSFKHAFPGGKNGEIQIKLSREENGKSENNRIESKNKECKSTGYTLIVSDNGVGIPESVNLENSSTPGTQLVTILVEQLNGQLYLKRDSGTEFIIKFIVSENR